MSYAEMCSKTTEKLRADQNEHKEIDDSSQKTEEPVLIEITDVTKDTEKETNDNEEAHDESIEEAKIVPKVDVKPGVKSKNEISPEQVFKHTDISTLFDEYNYKFLVNWSRTYNFHKWKHEHHENLAYLDPK